MRQEKANPGYPRPYKLILHTKALYQPSQQQYQSTAAQLLHQPEGQEHSDAPILRIIPCRHQLAAGTDTALGGPRC